MKEKIEKFKLDWQKHNRDNGLSWNEVGQLVNDLAELLTFTETGGEKQSKLNYVKIVKQSDQEKKDMYMKTDKEKIVEMLIECNKCLDIKVENEPITPLQPTGEKHTHIQILDGKAHVTWHGDEPPSDEQMKEFEKMAQCAYDNADEITKDHTEPKESQCKKCGKIAILKDGLCYGCTCVTDSNEVEPKERMTTVPYQLCPKCNGQGTVSKPPYVAGDVYEWSSSSCSFTCDVCNGAKIIPMYVINEVQTDKEIVHKAKEVYPETHRSYLFKRLGFIRGAKWIRSQIK